MIIDNVAERVEAACRPADNGLASALYQEHILVVVDPCERLGNERHADREILLLSSLLHDFSAIKDIRPLSDHAARGSEAAESLWRDLDYPRERAAGIKQAILRHSAAISSGEGSVKEVVLSNADTVSPIVSPSFWLYSAHRVRSVSFEEGPTWYSRRMAANWERMTRPARDMAADRYEQVRALLSGSKIG